MKFDIKILNRLYVIRTKFKVTKWTFNNDKVEDD